VNEADVPKLEKLSRMDSHAAPTGAENAMGEVCWNRDLSIFTAIPEQLGLKPISAKGPVETLVIDHIEKPDAN
jgi:uncharacterized protein (TIGR03435 family)